ncbi:hypothetical protein JBO49_07705 [Serratia fonticola]|uniref:hypothetical protein n=1 Tax=Serratia fonticola TaxID=47917 RepID=UPI00192BFA05|nr:hypothetical protein [Serratia fonticola]MBL5860500.1 hypothetical protein [Serratia fonticola]
MFFYRPTATDFIINTGDNFSAYYYAHEKEKENFTFIGDHPVKVSKNISLFGSFDNLAVVKNDNSKYDIEIGVYQGCIKETSNERIKNNYLKKFTDVSEFSFTPPKMSFFGYIDSKESGNSLLVKDASITAFASQLSDDKKSRRMSKSSAKNDINYFMDNSGVTIHIITPTFASDEDKKKPIQKLNFHFKIGDLQKNINMTIKRNTINNIKKIQSCSWINISNNYELDIDDLATIGLIIRVTPKNNEYYYPEGGESGRAIIFSNLTGTININDVSLKSKLSSYVKPGFLSGFNVFSPKSVTIDDVSLEVKPGDTINSYKSEVYAQVTEEGEVLLKGTSKHISRNGSRLNKTLWEGSNAWSLSGVTVLGAIFVSLGFLIRKFFDVYNKNETISKIFKA